MREILKKKFSLWLFFILLCFVLGGGAVWFLLKAGYSAKEIRNVLLISIDTCRADYLSCYGYPRRITPNIDTVADEGFLFENAVTPIPLTLPAHSSMLTGTTPLYHGIHDNLNYQLGQSNVTLAEILKNNGFTTGAIISGFVMDSQFGLDQGFDTYNDRFDEDIKSFYISERRGEEASHYALQWLEEHHREPFFLFLHYFDPHYAYIPPEPFASEFQNSLYAGEIAYTDQCVGQIIKKLKQLRLYNSTLIIITSDHGEMLGEHGELTHDYFIYQSAIKVPLIFRLPGQRKSKRIEGLVGIVDIVPTVCSLLGIEPPNQLKGQDISGCFSRKNKTEKERYIYCESLTPTKYNASALFGVVTDSWKYIQTTRPELYNLVRDPQESNNLVFKEPKRADLLKKHLESILEQQLRKDDSDSKQELDEESIKRLESLGYIGGSISEDFTFDHSKDDPKDLIDFHNRSGEAERFISQKNYTEAKKVCEKMLRQRPNFLDGHVAMAKIATRLGDYAAAIPHLYRALELKPDYAKVHEKLGAALLVQGKLDEAVNHFHQALQIRPKHVEAHNNLGITLAKQGKLSEALSHFRQALQIEPDNAETCNNIGFVLSVQGKLDEADRDDRKCLRINPRHKGARQALKKLLAKRGKGSKEENRDKKNLPGG
jgi:arylsulfatase A-like enzyme/Tfp pilus assembly protein PilF